MSLTVLSGSPLIVTWAGLALHNNIIAMQLYP